MKESNKKKTRKVLGYIAKGAYCAVCGAAALGAAPFDKGYTMRCVGNAITCSTGGVFHEIDKWVKG